MKIGEIKIESLRLMLPNMGSNLQIEQLTAPGLTEAYRSYLRGMIGSINRCLSDIETRRVIPPKVFVLTANAGSVVETENFRHEMDEIQEYIEDFKEDVEAGRFKGEPGRPGNPGAPGPTGTSAYQYAVQHGYAGTEAEFGLLMALMPGIMELIPATASEENKLADKDFVNSSIATNTANYISKTVGGVRVPFDSLAELQAYAGTVTNNDYAFVTGTDTEGNAYFDRYKASVSGSTVTWAKEYRLNNSSFTAVQWAAIDSGITAALTAKITQNAADIGIKLNADAVTHETWTFTLDDDTTVTKEVVLWNSQA